MKNAFRSLLSILVVSATIVSCSPDYDSYDAPSTKDLLTKANWSVQIVNNTQVAAHDYSGYTLSFDQRGAAVLHKNTENLPGNWAENNDVVSLNIQASDVLVQELNKQWKVSSKNSSNITFSSDNGSTDYKMILTKQ